MKAFQWIRRQWRRRKPMTMRDELAMHVATGVMAFPGHMMGRVQKTPEMIAEYSYLVADAMLEERSK
jgi:uncharacterized membrane protein YjjB (DUF3815 family)